MRFDGLKFTVFDSQNTPALHSNNIRALCEDRRHALWIGTADGITVFRDRQNVPCSPASKAFPAIASGRSTKTAPGSSWVVTASGVADVTGTARF